MEPLARLSLKINENYFASAAAFTFVESRTTSFFAAAASLDSKTTLRKTDRRKTADGAENTKACTYWWKLDGNRTRDLFAFCRTTCTEEFLSKLRQSRGCNTSVEHKPHNLEVMGLNPAGCWAFISFFFLFFQYLPTFFHQWSVLNRVSQGGASLNVCCERNRKNGCLAMLPETKPAQ